MLLNLYHCPNCKHRRRHIEVVRFGGREGEIAVTFRAPFNSMIRCLADQPHTHFPAVYSAINSSQLIVPLC